MKNNQIIIVFFLISLLFTACYKDKGNYDYHAINQLSVNGFEKTYRMRLNDILNIKPEIQASQQSEYQYVWSLIGSSFFINRGDTLSLEKDLTYQVEIPAGNYKIVYEVTDVKTNVATYSEALLEVASDFSDGWIVLKDNGEETDIDMFTYEGVLTRNLMKGICGSALKGKARDIGFQVRFTLDDKGQQQSSKCLIVMSDSDMRIIRADNMTLVMEYEDMFYDLPEKCNPQKMFYAGGGLTTTLVNDNILYTSPGTGRSTPLFQPVYVDDSRVAPKCFTSSDFFQYFYNETEGMTVSVMMELDPSPVSVGLKGLDLMHIYGDGRVVTYLFRQLQHPDSLFIVKQMNGMSLTPAIDTLPDHLKLAKETCIANNWNFAYLYFTSGSQLWVFDCATKTEKLIDYDFRGEEITFVAHINRPFQASMDHLLVATYKNGNYTLYKFPLLTGTPRTDEEPQVFRGQGRVQDVFHQSFYNSENYSHPNNY